MQDPLSSIRANKHTGKLRHSYEALKRSIERNISPEQIRQALNSTRARILRNDLHDVSPSCTILGWDEEGRAIHTVVAYSKMLVITVYEPTPPKWKTAWERAE